jgi:lipoprotein-anchoring transpeptidase ErfK/SrfK
MIRPRHLVSLGALAVALVFTDAVSPAQTIVPAPAEVDMNVEDQPGIVPSPDQEQLNGPWEKQVVFYRTSEPPGTIIIVTAERFLYLVQGNNRAIRYGIGVGREGFQWSGLQKISRKQEWPDWRPPPETIGHAVSSGCFRLVNNDVIDLYDRVPVGTRVIIKQAASL